MRRDPLQATAFHEAGHAVAAWDLGIAIRAVSIVPIANGPVGHVIAFGRPAFWRKLEGGEPRRDLIENYAIMALAGSVAERHCCGRFNHVGAAHDYAIFAEVLLTMCGGDENEYTAWTKLLQLRTRRLLAVHWAAVEALASELLKQRTIRGRAAREILDRTLKEES